MNFQQSLKRGLRKQSLTPTELAFRLGFHHSLIFKYLHDSMQPSLGNAKMIADELGFSLDKLTISGRTSLKAQKLKRKRRVVSRLKRRIKELGA